MLATVAVFLLFSGAPPRPQGQPATWLNPSDAEIQFAINQGYSLKPKVKFNVINIDSWDAMRPRVRLVPPLSCAESQGETAARRLAVKPSVESVRNDCRGLTVQYQAFQRGPNSALGVLLMHGNDTIKPASSELDSATPPGPPLRGPLSPVMSTFAFDLPAPWTDKVQVRYSDGYNVATKTVNLDVFAKDEAAHRTK